MKTYKIIILSILFSFVLIFQSPFYAHGVSISTLRSEAAQGNAGAENNLGVAYQHGSGVPKNYFKAVYWYKKSANQGNSDGEFSLYACYHLGKGVPANDSKAAYWLRKSAAQGNILAEDNLGIAYYYGGEGVSKNYSKAVYWWKKAAAQGDSGAKVFLAIWKP